MLSSLHNSLERLQTDYVDLYMIHGPNPEISIEETMKAMDKLFEEGLIKNIAVSNFTVERLKQAQAASSHKIVANQLHFNLIYREPERRGLVKYCQKNDIMLVAWRPIQKGILSSDTTKIMQEMCQKYQKTQPQIAINWLVSQQNIVTLSKMTSKKHLEENLGALDFAMTPEDIEKLDKEFPEQKDVSDAVPLV